MICLNLADGGTFPQPIFTFKQQFFQLIRYKFLNKSAEFITKIEGMIRDPHPEVMQKKPCRIHS